MQTSIACGRRTAQLFKGASFECSMRTVTPPYHSRASCEPHLALILAADRLWGCSVARPKPPALLQHVFAYLVGFSYSASVRRV